MRKVKIKIITLGHIPSELKISKIKKWKSTLIDIDDSIESFPLQGNADLYESWAFSDEIMLSNVKNIQSDSDFMIAITGVPLENNYYLRRLKDSKIILTLHEIKDYLNEKNIPLENALFRIIYELYLVYISSGNRIPELHEAIYFTHDETRGCIFDMTGIKPELADSCNKPIVCEECKTSLGKKAISKENIKQVEKELKNIKKEKYYSILDFTKKHPLFSIFLSIIVAFFVNLSSSIVYDIIKAMLK